MPAKSRKSGSSRDDGVRLVPSNCDRDVRIASRRTDECQCARLPASSAIEVVELRTPSGAGREYRVFGQEVRVVADRIVLSREHFGSLTLDREMTLHLASLCKAWRKARVQWAAYDGAGGLASFFYVSAATEFEPLRFFAPGKWQPQEMKQRHPRLQEHLAARRELRLGRPRAAAPPCGLDVAEVIESGRGDILASIVAMPNRHVAVLGRRVLVVVAGWPRKQADLDALADLILDGESEHEIKRSAVLGLWTAALVEAAANDLRAEQRK